MNDLEHAIEGLPRFEQSCPLQIPVLGHFGALQIVLQKKKKQGNLISPHAKSNVFWFKFQKIRGKARTEIQRI